MKELQLIIKQENGLITGYESLDGRKIDFEYDGNKIISISNDELYTGLYSYDGDQLVEFEDSDGVNIKYGYNSDNEIYCIILSTNEYKNKTVVLERDALIPIILHKSNDCISVRLIDECGIIVDYLRGSNIEDMNDFYGVLKKKRIEYEIRNCSDKDGEKKICMTIIE